MSTCRRVPGVPGGEVASGVPSGRVLHGHGVTEFGGQGVRAVRETRGGSEHLTQDGQFSHDQRYAGRQGLHRGQTEAFLEGGEGEGCRGAHQGRQFVVGHRPEHDRFDTEFEGSRLPAGGVNGLAEGLWELPQ